MNRSYTPFSIALLAFLLWACPAFAYYNETPKPPAVPPTSTAGMSAYMYLSFGGTPKEQLPKAMQEWEKAYLSKTDTETKQQLFDNLLETGLKGDFNALALATVVAQNDVNHPHWGQIDTVLEPWMMQHLGTGEASWLMALFGLYRLGLWTPYPDFKAKEYVEYHFRRGALADHPKAMGFARYLPTSSSGNFTPPTGKEVKDPPLPEYLIRNQKEKFYWLQRASEAGNAIASTELGQYLADKAPNKPMKEATELAMMYWDRGARQGSTSAAAISLLFLEKGYCNPENFDLTVDIDCKKAFFYLALRIRIINKGQYVTDPTISKGGAAAAARAQWYLEGNPEEDIDMCLTKKEYDEALIESKQAYDEYAVRKKAEDDALEQLYTKARQALPELRAQIEEYKKNYKPEPTPTPEAEATPTPETAPVE